jgi:transposase
MGQKVPFRWAVRLRCGRVRDFSDSLVETVWKSEWGRSMTYALGHEKELLDRSIRRRMGVSGDPYSGSQQARTSENPHSTREILNAIFYVSKSGCPWRLLPRDFPPWETVYWWFRRWRIDGTFEHLNAALRGVLRARSGKNPLPSAGIAGASPTPSRPRPPVLAASRGATTATRRSGAGSDTCWWTPKGWS